MQPPSPPEKKFKCTEQFLKSIICPRPFHYRAYPLLPHALILTLRLVPRHRMRSASSTASAASCQLYGEVRPPFSPKCTMVSLRGVAQSLQNRPVLCRRSAVRSVTSNKRKYER